ncbi:acetyltransferase [Kaistella haifensis DSM 19056]|uniref:Acetyltransferase n=1 Tax=Kaistella haifensis DSM 19056 TaxID=1450526 RepID=A0A246B825_9FLAO|nr:acyltransferase [Kaistella haifensis]OWK97553.1 acetyltransferase [Kaistella haifensis DSM 19056]
MKSLLSYFFKKTDALRNIAFREFNMKLLKQNSASTIAPGFRLGSNNTFDISPKAIFELQDNTTINHHNFITVKDNAVLSVGKNTYITRATISCLDRIEIGENCILGEGLKIFDHNHKYTTEPFSVAKTDFNTAPIKIGNNVWTGANCIILKGVTIGNNVILGAGCVIYKDVPDNTIVMNKQELIYKNL